MIEHLLRFPVITLLRENMWEKLRQQTAQLAKFHG